jgi:hypothetical protein
VIAVLFILMPRRFGSIARFAVVAGFGAQLGSTLLDVRERRATWTRIIAPAIAFAIAVDTFAVGPRAFGAIVSFFAVDVGIAAIASIAVLRALKRAKGTDPEEVLEREFERYIALPAARFIAVDLVTVGAAVRYCLGGFRRKVPPGFSYVRSWSEAPILLAAPLVFVFPEMVFIDLVAAKAHWYWHAASDALHVYAALWCVGIFALARLRPHRCDAQFVRLRFGALRRCDVPRSAIANAIVHATILSARSLRGPRTLVFAFSGAPAVELRLGIPIVVRSTFGRLRDVDRLFVSVDDPHAFIKAVA